MRRPPPRPCVRSAIVVLLSLLASGRRQSRCCLFTLAALSPKRRHVPSGSGGPFFRASFLVGSALATTPHAGNTVCPRECQSPPPPRGVHSSTFLPPGKRTRTTCYLKSSQSDEEEDAGGETAEEPPSSPNQKNVDEPVKDVFRVEDARLLAVDLASILVASEFLGLFDAIGREGLAGLLNPITANDFDNLPFLVRRDSALSICWILACLRRGGYLYDDRDDSSGDSLRSAAESALDSLLEFSALLAVGNALAVGVGVFFGDSGATADGVYAKTVEELPFMLEVLREAAVSFAVIVSFRSILLLGF